MGQQALPELNFRSWHGAEFVGEAEEDWAEEQAMFFKLRFDATRKRKASALLRKAEQEAKAKGKDPGKTKGKGNGKKGKGKGKRNPTVVKVRLGAKTLFRALDNTLYMLGGFAGIRFLWLVVVHIISSMLEMLSVH